MYNPRVLVEGSPQSSYTWRVLHLIIVKDIVQSNVLQPSSGIFKRLEKVRCAWQFFIVRQISEEAQIYLFIQDEIQDYRLTDPAMARWFLHYR